MDLGDDELKQVTDDAVPTNKLSELKTEDKPLTIVNLEKYPSDPRSPVLSAVHNPQPQQPQQPQQQQQQSQLTQPQAEASASSDAEAWQGLKSDFRESVRACPTFPVIDMERVRPRTDDNVLESFGPRKDQVRAAMRSLIRKYVSLSQADMNDFDSPDMSSARKFHTITKCDYRFLELPDDSKLKIMYRALRKRGEEFKRVAECMDLIANNVTLQRKVTLEREIQILRDRMLYILNRYVDRAVSGAGHVQTLNLQEDGNDDKE